MATIIKGKRQGSSFTAYKCYRVRNLNAATGNDAQWVCYEVMFLNGDTDLTEGGTQLVNGTVVTNSVLFDKAFAGNFDTVNANTINDWVGYEFANPVKVSQIKISNLNNGSNVPPTQYSVDACDDRLNWVSLWTFNTGTEHTRIYNSARTL